MIERRLTCFSSTGGGGAATGYKPVHRVSATALVNALWALFEGMMKYLHGKAGEALAASISAATQQGAAAAEPELYTCVD